MALDNRSFGTGHGEASVAELEERSSDAKSSKVPVGGRSEVEEQGTASNGAQTGECVLGQRYSGLYTYVERLAANQKAGPR